MASLVPAFLPIHTHTHTHVRAGAHTQPGGHAPNLTTLNFSSTADTTFFLFFTPSSLIAGPLLASITLLGTNMVPNTPAPITGLPDFVLVTGFLEPTRNTSLQPNPLLANVLMMSRGRFGNIWRL